MLFLTENVKGYGLVKKKENKKHSKTTKKYNLKKFYKYKKKSEIILTTEKLIKGKVAKNLKKFLRNNIKKKDILFVNDIKLKISINQKINNIFCNFIPLNDSFREIKEHLIETSKTNRNFKNKMLLGLCCIIYSKKIKFSGSRLDVMIGHGIKILEEIEKKANFYSIKLKEWYGWHFPELCSLITDNLLFAKLICKFENKKNFKIIDASDILNIEHTTEIRKTIEASMGFDIEGEDLENIIHLSKQIVSLYELKETIKKYIKNRMYTIAPNLTVIVGEKIGARLISHTNSLLNLAKCSASSIQIFGAERAMFRSKKYKTTTPKFGMIYNSDIISKASCLKNKGKISRMLSGKIALSTRVDALGEFKKGGAIGLKSKTKVEKRLTQLESFSMKNSLL